MTGSLHASPAILSLGARFLQFVAIRWALTSQALTLMLAKNMDCGELDEQGF